MPPRGDKKAEDSVNAAIPAEKDANMTPTIADTVIQVDDKLYSAQKLAETHPGGYYISAIAI